MGNHDVEMLEFECAFNERYAAERSWLDEKMWQDSECGRAEKMIGEFLDADGRLMIKPYDTASRLILLIRNIGDHNIDSQLVNELSNTYTFPADMIKNERPEEIAQLAVRSRVCDGICYSKKLIPLLGNVEGHTIPYKIENHPNRSVTYLAIDLSAPRTIYRNQKEKPVVLAVRGNSLGQIEDRLGSLYGGQWSSSNTIRNQ
jgi:hypothetical protein